MINGPFPSPRKGRGNIITHQVPQVNMEVEEENNLPETSTRKEIIKTLNKDRLKTKETQIEVPIAITNMETTKERVSIKVKPKQPSQMTQTNRRNDNEVLVGARLTKYHQNWSDSTHHETVRYGALWRWKNKRPSPKKGYQGLQRTSDTLDEAVLKMQTKGVTRKYRHLKFVSQLFQVPKKQTNELRTILNLKNLNKFIKKTRFRMLTFKEIALLLPRGAWTVSIDLKDGFYHVKIRRNLQPYLGFIYRDQGWMFKAMPFGLTVAPQIFTHLIAYAMNKMKLEGIPCLPFLDDLLIWGFTFQQCHERTTRAIKILEDLGWLINREKSRLTPHQNFEWLGRNYDTVKYTQANTELNLKRFQDHLRDLLIVRTCTKRQVMQVQGMANWLGAIDPEIRACIFATRRLLKKLKGVKSLDTPIILAKEWKSTLCQWIYRKGIPNALGNPEPDLEITTDASGTGWGFHTDSMEEYGDYDESMKKFDSNFKELSTILIALLTVERKRITVQVNTDNTTAIAAINKTLGVNWHLAGIAQVIWRLASKMNWTLIVTHIAGQFNIIADQLSRGKTISTEWSIPKEIFNKEILSINNKLEVDLFATNLNKKLPIYISPCQDKDAAAQNALKTSWKEWKHLYMYPPTPLILKAFLKLQHSNPLSAILVTRKCISHRIHSFISQRMILEKTIQVARTQMVRGEIHVEPQTSSLLVWRL